MRDYFEKEICTNCCIDKQFCERCGVRKKTANPEKEKPALMARLQESDKNCDGNCKNCVAICGTTQNTIFLEAAGAIEELLAAVPKWISVEERLPEKGEMVIVYYSWVGQSGTEYKEVSLATLGEMRYCGNKLLGWMPLPKAPKED